MGDTITAQRWRTWRPKSVAFLDWRTGNFASSLGIPSRIPPRAPLGDVLAILGRYRGIERIYVVGPRIGDGPDDFRAWLSGDTGEWTAAKAGHYLENLDAHTLRFVSTEGLPRSVEILRSAGYFGERAIVGGGGGGRGVAEHLEAYKLLDFEVGQRFDGGTLLASPATTGRDLFARTLGDRTYPVADPEHQSLIRATTGQGRIELVAEPGAELPGLAEYDGRLMYGALCWGLGSGVAEDYTATSRDHERGLLASFHADPMLRARYLIRFMVPRHWGHVGLVGVWDGERWTYPRSGGATHETWVEGSELALMDREGWRFTILRRLTLDGQGGKPLDTWARKLVELRQLYAPHPGGVGQLVAAGARSILLHAIGAFMGREHVVTRTAPVSEPARVPITAVGARIEGETIVWGERQPVAWPELSHPEWAAAIWGRCRARMLSGPTGQNLAGWGNRSGALHVPLAEVVGFKTDALYLTAAHPWPDDGAAGRLRLRSFVKGPVRAPATVHQLKRGYGR